MIRLLTLAALGLALVSTLAEARSKRIHVTAEVTQATFTGTGTPDDPQLGDRSITSVDLFDENHTKVGTGAGFCTVVSVAPLDTRVQCLLSATFDDEGQIIFGGVAPLPEVRVAVQFGILGGTEKFRKARGDVTITVLTPDLTQDVTIDLE